MKRNFSDVFVTNIILSELILGIIVYGLIVQLVIDVIAIIKVKSFFYYSTGLWIGIILAAFLAIHMNNSISKALDLDEDSAIKLSKKDSIVRYIFLLVIFAALMITDLVSPIVAFVGVIGLKAGAYMQPSLHRILRRTGPSSIRQFILEDDIKRKQMLEEYYKEQEELKKETPLQN